MKVILVLEGGVIQQVISDQDSLQIVVYDYDEGYDEDELSVDAHGNEVHRYELPIEVNPEFISGSWYEQETA